MNTTDLLIAMGFSPKENAVDVFQKKYSQLNDYSLEVDFAKEKINFGAKIRVESKTTQNFSQSENWVVLECVDRLLEKGYKPENIILEKTWAAGHGTSGRLDICVTREEDDSEYLLIECKTFGKEFDKEFNRMKKDGGQLFTYFKFSNKASLLMLYASELRGKEIVHRNEIVKIEDDYRIGDKDDFYEKWNKLTKDNGVFNGWVNPYQFVSKALTPKQLTPIKQEDSGFIFNRFLEILRHNVVSDKPNAFNKIFTLFLCKVYDEKSTKPNEELRFQWLEGKDNHVDFQLRLTDLYKSGMFEFLEKTVTDFSKDEFNHEFSSLIEEDIRKRILHKINRIRLEKNNEFAIKEVFDEKSFTENAKIVKEVVELLQGFRLRYNKRQQYLSDFFELLLTTGLKQESGQFFTPVPIAQFIIKSLPIDDLVKEKLDKGEKDNLLPYVIDFAAGSGHFLTESMHEIQRILDSKKAENYIESTSRKIDTWQRDHFDWATKYVYGIEKDYRLVKVGKVGCYLHGDGLANVILSDGLANFSKTEEYKGLLKVTDEKFPQENKQFDIVISNPPYSVSSFKNASREYYKDDDFELYGKLTDSSSEIECLFIERTKQLLKDGGFAGVILPSSILSNTGIYTKTREIILKYFELIAITELGSNTFMATGTNTVVLFLRRRNNYDSINFQIAVDKFFKNFSDITINGIERPAAKYVTHTWEEITFEDYLTFVKKAPNDTILNHEIYKEYRKKIKAKNEDDLWKKVLNIENEKLFYFILAYPQKTVLVKSGEKKAEKQFLGYEFSNRRGSEGIHPIRRGKSISECTQLFDEDIFDNPEKASTYVYKAFKGDFETEIQEDLKKNVSRVQLIDMMTFDRFDFEKGVSTAAKKKVNFEEIWGTSSLTLLSDIANIEKGKSITQTKTKKGKIPVIAGGKKAAYFHNESNREGNVITVSASGANSGFVNYHYESIFASDCNTVVSKDEKRISTFLIFNFLKIIQPEIYDLQRGQAQPHVYGEDLAKIKIPFPPKEIQEKIVDEIKILEEKNLKKEQEVELLKKKKSEILNIQKGVRIKLEEITSKIGSGATPRGGEASYHKVGISLIRSQNVYDDGFKRKGLVFINSEQAKKLDNVTVQKNDVLFNITGASVLRCCLVEPSVLPARVNQHVAIIRANERVLPKYLQQVLVSAEIKSTLLKIAESATTREAITKGQLEEFKINLPPLIDQQKIVTQIEKIESRIADLEKQLSEIPAQKEAILKKYL